MTVLIMILSSLVLLLSLALLILRQKLVAVSELMRMARGSSKFYHEAYLEMIGENRKLRQAQLQEQASAIQAVTIYEDDLIASATALMQNIGQLSADQLPKAQKAAIGLAAAYRIDLTTAFQLVGKAAAGNTVVLGRYGIVLKSTGGHQEKLKDNIFTICLALMVISLAILTPRHPWPEWKLPCYIFCGLTLAWLAPDIIRIFKRRKK